MVGMDLAALSVPELRRLLDVARSRAQAQLEKQVLTELQSRGSRGWAPGPAEPDPFAVGDPSATAPSEGEASPPARGMALVVLAVSATVVAIGLGWWLTAHPTAQAPPSPPPPALTEPVAVAPPAPIPAVVEAPAVAPKAEAAPPSPASSPAPGIVPRPVAAKAVHVRSPCLKLAKPADRLVCGYPTLHRQHQRMLAAYDRALAAGNSRPAVDAAQARWRAKRDRISDRATLAAAYQSRTRALEDLAAHPAHPAHPAHEDPIY